MSVSRSVWELWDQEFLKKKKNSTLQESLSKKSFEFELLELISRKIASLVLCENLVKEIHSAARFYGKNFVKATHLLKKSLNSWFDEIFFG